MSEKLVTVGGARPSIPLDSILNDEKTAVHDFGAGHADWVMTGGDIEAGSLILSGTADAPVNVIATPKGRKLFIVVNTCGQPATPHIEAIKLLSQGVQIWCDAHRDELTQGGKTKTATLGSGTVQWRMNPPKCVLRGTDAILKALKALGLQRFIRTKEEVNKEAILAEPAAVNAVPGIRIEQTEEFVITPFEAELQKAVYSSVARFLPAVPIKSRAQRHPRMFLARVQGLQKAWIPARNMRE
jgi:phage host-nuclease inhibitor protein Gam